MLGSRDTCDTIASVGENKNSERPATQLLDIGALAPGETVAVKGFRLVQDSETCWTSDGELCRIGSHPGNDVVIDDPTVSRFHCEIRVNQQGIQVRDLESSNGVLINDVRVTGAWLSDGSKLTLGRSELYFHFGDTEVQLPVSEQDHFGSMVGTSTAMRRVFDLLSRCSGTDTTILLEGETGTGKEEAARSIHAESLRADAPFVVIDCGAMPPNLLESELFGHEKGSFTGATDQRKGAFEFASGGTIFIDELGELPPELQPKLLRVLEQRTVRRVGGNEELAVDVRVIAATNRRLESEVNEGNFRSDLFYRLAVIRVELPALRERLDDLPQLTRHILKRLDATQEQRERLLGSPFQAKMSRATWPGNVRELRNYLERSLILEGDLPVPTANAGNKGGGIAINPNISWTEARRVAIDHFESGYLAALLETNEGNVSKAARSAEMDRVYLHRLLRKHGIR